MIGSSAPSGETSNFGPQCRKQHMGPTIETLSAEFFVISLHQICICLCVILCGNIAHLWSVKWKKHLKCFLIVTLLVSFRKSKSPNLMASLMTMTEFSRKLRNSSFCACAVQSWPKHIKVGKSYVSALNFYSPLRLQSSDGPSAPHQRYISGWVLLGMAQKWTQIIRSPYSKFLPGGKNVWRRLDFRRQSHLKRSVFLNGVTHQKSIRCIGSADDKYWLRHFACPWIGGVMVRTLDLWLAVAGSNPGHDTAWLFPR